jgi:hypothetical protein
MREINRTLLATAICCVSVVVTGWWFENSVFSLSIVAALCIGSLSYRASVWASFVKAAKLFLLNAGLLALIFAMLQVTLNSNVAWPLHRIYRMWWLSQCTAIILTLIAAGLVTIEVAGRIGGNAKRKRFQSCMIGGTFVLVAVNIVHFLRPVWCADCFFPYGLPFTLFKEGGYAGGGGFVWTGLVADAALIPTFAAICTLVWNQIAKSVGDKSPFHS